LLRLDTDFYESTAAEMEILYPRLTPGGVLIVDDYGTWAGAKKAVDEYLDKEPLLKCAVDSDCIVATKV
jgi:O-methyltransferase